VLRAVGAATRSDQLVEWLAQDGWPGKRLHRDNVLLVGDAAHAMLPTLGQGACQALEDAAELARCIATMPTIKDALRFYQRRRLWRGKLIVGLARVGAVSRRSTIISRAIPEVAAARLLAVGASPIMRQLTKPNQEFGPRFGIQQEPRPYDGSSSAFRTSHNLSRTMACRILQVRGPSRAGHGGPVTRSSRHSYGATRPLRAFSDDRAERAVSTTDRRYLVVPPSTADRRRASCSVKTSSAMLFFGRTPAAPISGQPGAGSPMNRGTM
jgi:hypothetical protein